MDKDLEIAMKLVNKMSKRWGIGFTLTFEAIRHENKRAYCIESPELVWTGTKIDSYGRQYGRH